MNDSSTADPRTNLFQLAPVGNRYLTVLIAILATSTLAIVSTGPAIARLGPLAASGLGVATAIALLVTLFVAGRSEQRRNAASPTLAAPVLGMLAPFTAADSANEAALRVDQARHIFGQLRLMMAVTAVNSVLVTITLWASADSTVIGIWLALVLALAALGWWVGRPRQERQVSTTVSKRSLRRIALHSGIRGLLWGACFALFFSEVGTSGQHILLTTALGMTAGGVTALAPVPAAALLYGLGALAPTVVRLATMGSLDYLLLAGLGVMFGGTMTMVAGQLYRSFAEGLVARREQAEQAATIALLLNDFEQSAADWLWETDAEGRFVRLPERMSEALGILTTGSTAAATLSDVFERAGGNDREALRASLIADAPFRDLVLSAIDLQGLDRRIALTASAKPEGGYRGVARDVTSEAMARLEAGLALERTRQAEQRLKDAIGAGAAGFVLTDGSDTIVLANQRFNETFPASTIRAGALTFRQVIEAQAALWPQSADATDWASRLIESRTTGTEPVDIQLPTGRWLRAESRTTIDSGLVTVLTDVSDIKEKEAALAASTQRLANSNRELQQFAAVASHDLQEPLRKIEAFGARLASRTAGTLDAESALFLDRMLASTKRMRRLITDLLAYSRVTRHAASLEPVDLDQVLSEVLDDLSIAVVEKGASIEVDRLGMVMGTPSQLRQLMQNLISNALKFTRADVSPRIAVTFAGITDGFVRIDISDNGIGFDMRHHDKIFEIFQRLHGRDVYEGTGIGLATCRRITEQIGGSLSADSVPGEGTTFHIRLPSAASDRQNAPRSASTAA